MNILIALGMLPIIILMGLMFWEDWLDEKQEKRLRSRKDRELGIK